MERNTNINIFKWFDALLQKKRKSYLTINKYLKKFKTSF